MRPCWMKIVCSNRKPASVIPSPGGDMYWYDGDGVLGKDVEWTKLGS
jgi:hypothetical protein